MRTEAHFVYSKRFFSYLLLSMFMFSGENLLAQNVVVVDSTENYWLQQVNSIYPSTDTLPPRIFFKYQSMSIVIERPGTIYRETIFLDSFRSDTSRKLDSVATPFPNESVLDWGDAITIYNASKKKQKIANEKLLVKMKYELDSILGCKKMDVNNDGIQDLLVLRRAEKDSSRLSGLFSIYLDRNVICFELFLGTLNGFKRIAKLQYLKETTEFYFTRTHDHKKARILYYLPLGARKGDFTIGCDEIGI